LLAPAIFQLVERSLGGAKRRGPVNPLGHAGYCTDSRCTSLNFFGIIGFRNLSDIAGIISPGKDQHAINDIQFRNVDVFNFR
jgi:hypothetical protein